MSEGERPIGDEARKLAISDLGAVEGRCLRKAAAEREAARKGVAVEHGGFSYASYEGIQEAYGIGAITEATFRRLAAELEERQKEAERGGTRWDEEAEIIDDFIWSLENMRPISEKGAEKP